MPHTQEEVYQLIDTCESINAIESIYWKEILPSMTEEQTERLCDIIKTEQAQLAKLNS